MSRFLLRRKSRHLPPWLIFDVRQKKSKMRNWDISLAEWRVLDALSDLYESPHSLSKLVGSDVRVFDDLVSLLGRLHAENYVFLTLNTLFDAEEIKKEIRTGDRRHWFGRTEKGYFAWLECRTKYEESEKEKGA